MNYISLGYCCAVANELEKLGLRTASSPFDWVISDFEGVMQAIRNRFVDFFEYAYLYQDKQERGHYKNTRYSIEFLHDFDKYKALEEQLPSVQKKYERRIDRFYKTIAEPTLFVRYISDEKTIEGVSQELIYIEQNYDWIIGVLKSFNQENDILFIANKEMSSSKFTIYNVEKDENDTIARNPISKNDILFNKFSCIDLPSKQANIERYLYKERYRKSIYFRLKRRVMHLLKKIFLKEYFHKNQY